MSDWTTLLDPQITSAYTAQHIHSVWFLPVSEATGITIGLLIPECELQIVTVAGGQPQCAINRPSHNKNIRYWLRLACKLAAENDCAISFACDTHKQAEHIAAAATKRLPNHRRIALERMHRPETRSRKGLA